MRAAIGGAMLYFCDMQGQGTGLDTGQTHARSWRVLCGANGRG
jgi:hypothetical protein